MLSFVRTSFFCKWKERVIWSQSRYTSSFKLLRSFYLAVHPDLFNGYPVEQKTNEESLKVLNSYLDSLERSHPVFSTSLTFYIKDRNTSVGNACSQISILLSSKSTSEAISDILEACNLPKEKTANKSSDGLRGWADSLQVFGSEKDLYSSSVGDLRFGHFNMKEKILTIDNWVSNNHDTVENNLRSSVPLKSEASKTLTRLKEKHGIQGLSKDSLQYSFALLSSGMKQLECILDRDFRGHHGCRGRIIKFGHFNGLDQLGRVVLNINDLPSDWTSALLSVGSTTPCLEQIKEVEHSLKEYCFGLKFVRPRASPSYPVQLYLKGLIHINCKQKEELPEKDKCFKDVLAIFEWDDDFLTLSAEGYVRVPHLVGRDALFQYINRNISKIKKARKDYLRNLQVEQFALESCKLKLGLASLEKDYTISSGQTVAACNELCTFGKADLMKNWCVMLSNYYSVSAEGLVRIPWNFTQ